MEILEYENKLEKQPSEMKKEKKYIYMYIQKCNCMHFRQLWSTVFIHFGLRFALFLDYILLYFQSIFGIGFSFSFILD